MALGKKKLMSSVSKNALKKNRNKLNKKKLKKGKDSSALAISTVNQNSSSIEEALLRAKKKLKLYLDEESKSENVPKMTGSMIDSIIYPSKTPQLKSVLKSPHSVFDETTENKKKRRVSFDIKGAESSGDPVTKKEKKRTKAKKLNGTNTKVEEVSNETNVAMLKAKPSSNNQREDSKKTNLPSSSESSSSQSSNKITKKRKLELPENTEEKASKLQKKDDHKILKASNDNVNLRTSTDESDVNNSNENNQQLKVKTLKSKLDIGSKKKVLKNKLDVTETDTNSLSTAKIVKDKKVLEASDDEGWEELSDCSGSDVDFDGDSEDEEAIKKDVESFMAKLDFESAKKQCHTEEDSNDENWEDDDNEGEESEEVESNMEIIGSDEEVVEKDEINEEELIPVLVKVPSPAKKEKLHIEPSVSNSIKASLSKFKLPDVTSKKEAKDNSITDKLNSQLKAAKFRMINEQLYTMSGKKAFKMFKEDPEAFKVYHDGFKTQVSLWPMNPLDTVVEWLNTQDKKWSVADFGCGEGELSGRVQQKVHSFDLVASKPHVIACDMAHVPLPPLSINVAVFCLSLMGTNVADFVKEANRVLRNGGIMKVAEVKSRITNVEEFMSNIQKFGFKCLKKPTDNKYFINFDFRKFRNIHNKELPEITLRPCLYKRR